MNWESVHFEPGSIGLRYPAGMDVWLYAIVYDPWTFNAKIYLPWTYHDSVADYGYISIKTTREDLEKIFLELTATV